MPYAPQSGEESLDECIVRSPRDPTGAGFFDMSMGTKFVELAYHELKQR